jgi:hypothetical protein
MKQIAVLNAAVITGLPSSGEVFQYEIKKLDLDTVKDLLKNNDFKSYIGHGVIADLLSHLLETHILENRESFSQEKEQMAICFKLRNRPPQGRFLSVEEVNTIGYDFFEVTRTK